MGVSTVAWVRRTLDLDSLRDLPDALSRAYPDPRRTWTWDGWPSEESVAQGMCSLDGADLSIYPHQDVLMLYSRERWRGFLSYADVRERVRVTTAKVLRVIGATEVIWLPDWFLNDWPEGAALTIDTVRSRLLADWGPPQPSVDSIEEAVVLAAERFSPKVWFEESVLQASNS